MKTFDNSGNVVGETTTRIGSDGSIVTSNTLYRGDHVVSQHVSVSDNQGNVRSTDVFGGKLIP